jgi:hypothetical protein
LPSPSPLASLVPSPSPTLAVAGSGAITPDVDEFPFAVMIDNIAEARPHLGLGAADVVYEAPAEAGIPRLMAVFLRAGGEARSIGPVRSTRDYFVYLANEYRTPLVHIGSSPLGFDALRTTGLPDVDESRGDGGFVRDRSRLAPHNAFVSTATVRSVLQQRRAPVAGTWGPLQFGPFAPGPSPATSLTIQYPGPEHYRVDYQYDPDQQRYRRAMDGRPHLDGATREQYTASSIVVQYVDVQPIPNDAAGRVNVSLTGNGQGLLVAGGTQVPLTWQRDSTRESTTFARADGEPFTLPEGQVWVQLVPRQTTVSAS